MLSQLFRLLLIILGGYFLYKFFFPDKSEKIGPKKEKPKTKSTPPEHKITVNPDEIKDATYNEVEDE